MASFFYKLILIHWLTGLTPTILLLTIYTYMMLHVFFSKKSHPSTVPPILSICSTVPERVNDFKYLSVLMSTDLYHGLMTILSTAVKLYDSLGSSQRSLWSTKSSKLYVAFIRPCLEYTFLFGIHDP